MPSWLEEAVQKWREAGRERGTKTWKLLADPQRYSNLFPDYLVSDVLRPPPPVKRRREERAKFCLLT